MLQLRALHRLLKKLLMQVRSFIFLKDMTFKHAFDFKIKKKIQYFSKNKSPCYIRTCDCGLVVFFMCQQIAVLLGLFCIFNIQFNKMRLSSCHTQRMIHSKPEYPKSLLLIFFKTKQCNFFFEIINDLSNIRQKDRGILCGIVIVRGGPMFAAFVGNL